MVGLAARATTGCRSRREGWWGKSAQEGQPNRRKAQLTCKLRAWEDPRGGLGQHLAQGLLCDTQVIPLTCLFGWECSRGYCSAPHPWPMSSLSKPRKRKLAHRCPVGLDASSTRAHPSLPGAWVHPQHPTHGLPKDMFGNVCQMNNGRAGPTT